MDGLTTSTPAARARSRRAVTSASAFIGVAAVGATGALALGLGSSSSAATDHSSTTQVPQSFGDSPQGSAGAATGGSPPMASSGGS